MSEVQLRQTYREKVYNYRPPWILRWGVTFFFIFLLLIIVVSGFIKYPDVVPATAEITTINPPAHVVAHVNGKIEQVLVKEGGLAAKDEVLVLLESQANLKDILKVSFLTSVLDTILTDSMKFPVPKPKRFKGNFSLGDIQGSYFELLLKYDEFFRFYNLGYFAEELLALEDKLAAQNVYLTKLELKRDLLSQQFKLSTNKFARDSSMYIKGGISQSELEQSSSNILQFKSTLTDMDLSILSNYSTFSQLNHDIEKLKLNHKVQKQLVNTNLLKSFQLLKAHIVSWEKNYLICSPICGHVSYTTFWSANQNVKTGEVVLSVVPEDTMQIKVRLQFPVQNSGKVKVGQRVNIKLHNYPFHEFGMLIGSMSNISSVPNNLQYSADVILENGLVTSYGERLPRVQQLTGVAEIHTDESSLLMRFFNPLKALLDENF